MGELLRQAQASERDVETATARVSMDDLNEAVSGKMQVLFPAAGGWNFFWTPKEGDHVVVGKLPNGTQEGYILGQVYTAGKMPQGGAPNIILIVSEDGKNVVRFDADKGTLDLVVDQTASMKCKNLDIEVTETANITTKNANIEASENVSVKAKKDINIKADQNVKIEAKDATVKTSGNTTIEAAEAKIKTTGNTTVEATGATTVKGATVSVEATISATVKAVKVDITGGALMVNGAAAPTGTGPFCALPACLFTGAQHIGNAVTGT